jgi:hypothetical protein
VRGDVHAPHVPVRAAALLVLAGWQARTRRGAGDHHAPAGPRRNVGDDYFLATYTQLEQHWKTLDRESDRVALADTGAPRRPHAWMAIVWRPRTSLAGR